MKLLRIFTSLTGVSLALGLMLALHLPAQTPEQPPASAVEQTEPTDTPKPEAEDVEQGLREVEPTSPGRSLRYHDERVGIGSDVLHEEGDSAGTVVAIFADAIVDGEVENETVTILGDLTINGRARGETVNVLGHLTINGEVDGQVVAVLSSVTLGPNAHVKGDFVSVGGRIDSAPGARIDGDIKEIPFLGDNKVNFDWLKAWIKHCFLLGRPLWFGENLGWVWMLVGAALTFYLFISLIMPGPVLKCARTMEQHPGFSVLSAALSLLLVPLAMIVLAVTGVGPLVVMFFMFFVGIFGKVVFFAWLGRRFTRNPENLAAPVAVLIGGLVTIVIYLIPIAGFIFQKLTGFIGTGIVLYSIVRAMQADRAKNDRRQADRAAAAAATAASATATTTAAPSSTDSGSTIEPPFVPTSDGAATPPPPPPGFQTPPVSVHPATPFSLLPRAGFWPRLAATLIDIVLLAIVLNAAESRWLPLTDYFLVLTATYHVVMWALKGTTIGGIVMGLRVVRLDDRPMDWSVAAVRGLGSLISFVILGVGFIWVAFDPECQSWHDKIAGTTIVRVPKGMSLI